MKYNRSTTTISLMEMNHVGSLSAVEPLRDVGHEGEERVVSAKHLEDLLDVLHVGKVGGDTAIEPLSSDEAPHDVDGGKVEEQVRVDVRARLVAEAARQMEELLLNHGIRRALPEPEILQDPQDEVMLLSPPVS